MLRFLQRCLQKTLLSKQKGVTTILHTVVILVMHFEQPIVSMSVIRSSYIPLQDNMVKVLLLLPTTIHCIFFLLWPLAWLEQGLALPTISTSQQQKVKGIIIFDYTNVRKFKLFSLRVRGNSSLCLRERPGW